MEDKEKERLLRFYYDNDSAELKNIIKGVLFKLNYANCNDLDEFYSIANMECWKAIESYKVDNEWGATFKTYLSSILIKKFLTEISKRKKKESINGYEIWSLNDDAKGLDAVTLIDMVSSNDNFEDDIISKLSDDTIKYLESLSKKQRQLAELIMDGYSLNDARIKMKLGKAELDNMLKFMRCSERKKVLKSEVIRHTTSEGGREMKNQTAMDTYKNDNYTVREIKKKMDNGSINFEHPLQRPGDQWSNKMKSDLISDILQGNPIPALIFAKQMIDGRCVTFDLDGKQRCTTVGDFIDDNFKISKNVSRNLISYQSVKKTADGKIITNEKGYPIFDLVDYDISGKYFSQFPDELQDRILDYNFQATVYLDCTNEDIAYHIQRYNQGKAMNSAQKGVTYLGEDFAREVKAITGLGFFQDNGFTFKQKNNGTFNRIIVESVMAINFLDDWKKTPEEMAIYLNKNAEFKMFEEVEDSIIRLQDIITKDVAKMFDAKNTFIWLTLFDRFKKYQKDDKKFIEFLSAFNKELKYKKVNGYTYLSLDEGKNTKDKSVLIQKLEHLETLMNDFFHSLAA